MRLQRVARANCFILGTFLTPPGKRGEPTIGAIWRHGGDPNHVLVPGAVSDVTP